MQFEDRRHGNQSGSKPWMLSPPSARSAKLVARLEPSSSSSSTGGITTPIRTNPVDVSVRPPMVTITSTLSVSSWRAWRSASSSAPHWRRVVGIYLGWNGDPVGGVRGVFSKVPLVNSQQLSGTDTTSQGPSAGSPAFQDALRQYRHYHQGSNLPALMAPSAPFSPTVRLIIIGHSMGALMLESGLLALLEDQQQPLIRQASPANASTVQLNSTQGLVSFPDLVLALNSAANSTIAKRIQVALDRHQLEEVGGRRRHQLFASADDVRHLVSGCRYQRQVAVRAGRAPVLRRMTDGHDPSLITHDFVETLKNSSLLGEQEDVRDFGQNWHCLQTTNSLTAASPQIPGRSASLRT